MQVRRLNPSVGHYSGLSILLVASVLAGCGSSNPSNNGTSTSSSSSGGSGGAGGSGGKSSTGGSGGGGGGSGGTSSGQQGGAGSGGGGSGGDTSTSGTAGSGGGTAGSGGTTTPGSTTPPPRPPRGSVPMVIPKDAWSRNIDAGGYIDGVPIGGFGAGSITWQYDGNFYTDRLNIGSNARKVDPSVAFYLYEKCGGAATMKKLNATGAKGAKYYALYPKAWFDYSGVAGLSSKVKVAQWTPVIPKNYKTSSYPLAVYEWEVSNPGTAACDVAIMFTYGGGSAAAVTGEKLTGIKLKSGDAEITLAASTALDKSTGSYQSGSAADLEAKFGTDGTLSGTAGGGAVNAVALKVSVPANGRVQFPMTLAWDLPTVTIGSTTWYREYTRHFARSGDKSSDIAKDALKNYVEWGNAVDDWHDSILNNAKYPGWLRTSMLNELYYYIVGGTVWEAGNKAGSPNDDPNEDMFSSLECFEYPGYGTSDVRFYGSWALAVNWPDIDKQEVKQFCDSVTTDRKDRPKALGTTAHDFGGDGKDVFVRWNTYQYRDSTQWKDLNSKLVLMAYRNYVLTGKTDKDLLTYCWPAIKMAMAKTKSQDSDKDGLPNSSGIDQTYDNMELKGNTAYCGTLYVAACEAAEEIAKVMGDTALAAEYKAQGDLGKGSLDKKLWNGKYYKIDDASDRIMSDQLAGQWYAKACGLPDIVPAANASSAFKVIYDNNFKKFDGGKHGIVNVLKADGSGDGSSEQTAEVWIGVVWGAVAGMIQEGLLTEASEVGQSMYNTIWDEGQFWFRTPEAWGSGLDHKRAWYYMRTNSVWAVKHAYDISKP